VSAGTLTLSSDTIAANITNGGAAGSGGAAGQGGLGTVTTGNPGTVGANGVAGNGLGSGIQVNSGATAMIFNTIVAKDTASSAPISTDVAGAFTSQGHNLIGDGSDSTGFSTSLGDQIGTSASPIDPLFGSLQLTYGGPIALLPGSPAIDAAGLPNTPAVPATDERGVPRDIKPDIGAFEYSAAFDGSGNSFPTLNAPTPQSQLSNAPTVFAGASSTFNLGSTLDDVTKTPWTETVTVNWGDNSKPTTSSVSWKGATGLQTIELGTQKHTYAAPGVYTVTESVKNALGVVLTESYFVNIGSLSVMPAATAVTAGTSDGLTVRVLDAFGRAVAGYTGTVKLSSTGSATFQDAVTGTTLAGGLYTFTSNDNGTHAFNVIETKAGTQKVTVASTTSGGPVGSTTIAVKPAAAAIVLVSGGSGQTATVNTAFASPLKATVTDAYGNDISGIAVIFSAPSSGASGTFTGGVTTVTVNTNAQGIASAPTFTANSMTGAYTVTASVMGLTSKASFKLTNQ
jgi:hypothetical protein